MKRKTVNKLFAAATAGFLFTNASIAANAEEMPEESGVVSEQNVSGKEAGAQAEADGGEENGEVTENVQPAEQPSDQLTEQKPEQPSDQLAEQKPEQPSDQLTEQKPEQPAGQPSDQLAEQKPDQPEDMAQTKPEESKTQITGPANFEEAKENLEEAEAEEEQAKADFDKAQAEADSAQKDVEEAEQEVQETDSALNEAQDKKQDAEVGKEQADAEVSKTEQAAAEAEKDLDKALENAGADKDAYKEVQQELDEKKEALNEAEDIAASVEAEYNEKKTAAEEAAAEAERLKAALDAANRENQAAKEEVSAAQTEQETAQKAYDQALKDNAGAGSEKLNLDKAQEELNAAREKVASGSLGFFQYLAGEGSGSASEAVMILTARDKSEVKGLGNESNWTAQSWEQFTSYTKIGDENDATSLENMRRAIAFIRECNELRMADANFPGLGALVVNDAMMAIAQLNANWATYNPDGTYNSHSKVFNAGENLAWYYLDVPGMTDPFQGWYYEEKKDFDNKTGGVTGHYENIVNGSYSATGFGVNLSEKSGDIRLNCAQEFSSASLMGYYSYGQSYSVDEYEARFMSYYNSVMKRLSDAQTAYNAAKDAYDKAVAAGTVTGGNDTDVSAKKAELDKATARLEAAKANAEEKLEKFNEAQAVYDAGIKKNETAQAEFEQIRKSYDNIQKDLQNKQEAYDLLCREIKDNYGEEVLEASDALAQARSVYREALASQAAADSELLKAEAELSAAVEAKAGADKKLQEKTDILAGKLENLQKAKDAHNLALANLAIAQADYVRLKPQTVHSTLAPSYEAVQTAADIGSLGDMIVDEIPGSDSKRIYFARRCSFKYFLDNCSSFIKNCAGGNLTIDCSDLMWFSFNKKTLSTLKDNPNLSLTIIFTYNGRKYTFTIPAGYDLDLLQDSNGWYGFMYLKMMFGGEEII